MADAPVSAWINGVEYIRVDIVDTIVAENDKMKKELSECRKPKNYPSARSIDVDPDGVFERAYAEVSGDCLTETIPK